VDLGPGNELCFSGKELEVQYRGSPHKIVDFFNVDDIDALTLCYVIDSR
jgi:hypothetical protein